MKKPVVVILLIVALSPRWAAAGGGGTRAAGSSRDPLYGNVDIRTVNMKSALAIGWPADRRRRRCASRRVTRRGQLVAAPYERRLLRAQANVSTAQARYRPDDRAATARKRDNPGRGGGETGAGRLRLCAKTLSAPARAARQQRHLPPTIWRNARSRDQAQATIRNRRRISCVSISPEPPAGDCPGQSQSGTRRRRRWPRPKLDLHDPCFRPS